jgi:hypothetical protein
MIVAEIAQSQLPKNIQDSVKKYLGDMTFDEASTWMDDIRKKNKYNYLKSLHYINIPKGQNYIPNASDKNCVIELQRVINQLNEKSKLSPDKINLDIKILIHLVGDIHQPLHVGYEEDKGGNAIEVYFLGKKSNLHHVWDTGIIQDKAISTNTCIKANSKLSKAELTAIRKINVITWLNESREYLGTIYAFQGRIIDETYENKYEVVIEKQLFDAGIRLAAVLNEVFSK